MELPMSGGSQEHLNCKVCGLTFNNEKHFAIHCNGTFHANRVAASRNASQNLPKSGTDDQQIFMSSSNPSYWTGMQQAFSYASDQQSGLSKSQSRSLAGQSRSDAATGQCHSQQEYVSYPLGKRAKLADKTAEGYEGLYGKPGFGWSDTRQGATKPNVEYDESLFNQWEPEVKSSSSKTAVTDTWKAYQATQGTSYMDENQRTSKPQDYDFGYFNQESVASSFSSQKSEVPSWLKMIEPAVTGSSKTESYKSSNMGISYGSNTVGSGYGQAGECEEPWKSSKFDSSATGKIRQDKEELYGKNKDSVHRSRWGTDEEYNRGQEKQPNAENSDRRNRRREDEDQYDKQDFYNTRNGSSTGRSELDYQQDYGGRDMNRREGYGLRDNSYGREDPYQRENIMSGRGLPNSAGRDADRQTVSFNRQENAFDRAQDAAGRRDIAMPTRVGRSDDLVPRVQSYAERTVAEEESFQVQWKKDGSRVSDEYGRDWARKSVGEPGLGARSTTTRGTEGPKDLQGFARTGWTGGGDNSKGNLKDEAAWKWTESNASWDAGPDSTVPSKDWKRPSEPSARSGAQPSAQNRAELKDWSQVGRGAVGRGRGIADMPRGTAFREKQQWPRSGIDDVLAQFKEASKKPGQNSDTGDFSYAPGSANKALDNYGSRTQQSGPSGKKTADQKGSQVSNWDQGFGFREKEKSFKVVEDRDDTGHSYWNRGFPAEQSGSAVADKNKTGQEQAQKGQWKNWSEEGGRAQTAGANFGRGQSTSLGRGQPVQDLKGPGKGVGFGHGNVKGGESLFGLGGPLQQPCGRGSSNQGGVTPGTLAGAQSTPCFQIPQAPGTGAAGRGGRGVFGNKPLLGPSPSTIDPVPPPGGRGRGISKPSVQKPGNPFGTGIGTNTLPTRTTGRIEFKPGYASLQEKNPLLSQQGLSSNCPNKAQGVQASGSSLKPAGITLGGKAGQSQQSVPSLLNMNVTPASAKVKTITGPNEKSNDLLQQQKTAVCGQKPEKNMPVGTGSSGAYEDKGAVAGGKSSAVSVSSSLNTVQAGRNIHSSLVKTPTEPSVSSVIAATAGAMSKQASDPKTPLLPVPGTKPAAPIQPVAPALLKQAPTAEAAAKKQPLLPTPKAIGGPRSFNPLDPASARNAVTTKEENKKSSTGDLPFKPSAPCQEISSLSGTRNVQSAVNNTCSPSKLDSKVTLASSAASETRIGLKSSDSQRDKGPPATITSAAARPVITARPSPAATATAAVASGSSATRQEPSKKLIALNTVPLVRGGDGKKEESDNADEFDPALSEALGQFFSEDASAAKTVVSVNSAKASVDSKKAGTISKSLMPKQEFPKTPAPNDDAVKKPEPEALKVTVKMEPVDFEDADAGAKTSQQPDQYSEDPIVELTRILPAETMKQITSGQASQELLDKVMKLLPADLLLQSVEHLKKLNVGKQASIEKSSRDKLPAESQKDSASKNRIEDSTSEGSISSGTKKLGAVPTSRVQVIQPRKNLPSSSVARKTEIKGQVLGSVARKEGDSNPRLPGNSVSLYRSPAKERVASSSGLKYDLKPSELKDLSFDEMLQLYQELLKDILGDLFEDDQKSSIISESRILDGLSMGDRELVLQVRRMTGISDLSKIVHTLNVMKSLNSEMISELGRLDKSVISSSLMGNEKAQARGALVLQQITNLMTKDSSEKTPKGSPMLVNRGSLIVGSDVLSSPTSKQRSSSGGGGVQSLLSLNFSETPAKPDIPGLGASGIMQFTSPQNSGGRALLPTPGIPPRPMLQFGEMMFPVRSSGLLPTPMASQNFPQHFPRPLKRSPDQFFGGGGGPPTKRWR